MNSCFQEFAAKNIQRFLCSLLFPGSTERMKSVRFVEEYPYKSGQRIDLLAERSLLPYGIEENEGPISLETDTIAFEMKSGPQDLHTGYGLNFVGDFNFLVIPAWGWAPGIYASWHKLQELGRLDVGIITVDKNGILCCYKESLKTEPSIMEKISGVTLADHRSQRYCRDALKIGDKSDLMLY